MTEKIVVLDPITDMTAKRLRALLPEGFVLAYAATRGEEHLKEIIADADYAIAGQVAVSGDVLRAANKLKLLHKWGVGVDNFDLDTARACGLRVARTTGSNALPVAEFTIGLILTAMRGIAFGHAELRKGEWAAGRLPAETFLLSGKTVGIIGFGAIGTNLARLLRSFGCEILYNKRNRLEQAEEETLAVSYASVDDLLSKSDVVSLNCPLTPETAGLINKSSLHMMKKTAVLVNVARGGVVIEEDLVQALRDGIIHSAAMDVFEIEPLPSYSSLRTVDNIVLTPHLAAIAADTFVRNANHMLENIQRVSRREPLPERDVVV